jgi:hypothetical protein
VTASRVAPSPAPGSPNWAEQTEIAISKALATNTPEAWGQAAQAAATLSDIAQTMQVAAHFHETAQRCVRAAQEASERAQGAARLAEETRQVALEAARSAEIAKQRSEAAALAARQAAEAAQLAQREALEKERLAQQAAGTIPEAARSAQDAARVAADAMRRTQDIEQIVNEARVAGTHEAWSKALERVRADTARQTQGPTEAADRDPQGDEFGRNLL